MVEGDAGKARATSQGLRRPNPCISIVFWNPRQTGACGAGCANARLEHAYPWYGAYSIGILAILQVLPQRKPPRAYGGGGPRRMGPHVGGRERPTRDDRQSVPWREEDAQGTLAFRNGYFSFGTSFTACPRFATTGMVMALAGQASTQALQRVQSASVRSP